MTRSPRYWLILVGFVTTVVVLPYHHSVEGPWVVSSRSEVSSARAQGKEVSGSRVLEISNWSHLEVNSWVPLWEDPRGFGVPGIPDESVGGEYWWTHKISLALIALELGILSLVTVVAAAVEERDTRAVRRFAASASAATGMAGLVAWGFMVSWPFPGMHSPLLGVGVGLAYAAAVFVILTTVWLLYLRFRSVLSSST